MPRPWLEDMAENAVAEGKEVVGTGAVEVDATAEEAASPQEPSSRAAQPT